MTIKEELPNTKEGLVSYINHSERQLDDSRKLISKMRNRIKGCLSKMYFIDKEKCESLCDRFGLYYHVIDGECKIYKRKG